ncbi:MAG: XRE family transcriptional regulator [Microbacterium sp.]|nr:XRE family transcriptional regulator [Microbacterium sp.]MBA4345880.1 XRE family transcriptional regulator [Microbacterium sp.]
MTIGFEWRLREVMASAGIFATSKLVPLLRERGIELSSSQIYRLAVEKPERLNLHVLVALMDIFECSADDLIHKVNLGAAVAATGTSGDDKAITGTAAIRDKGLRPPRARVISPDA